MRTEISHFWIGYFQSENNYFDFFGEKDDYYEDEREIEEKYISEFAKTQGEYWIDHDFIENGFDNSDNNFMDKFKKYSYSEQWISELNSKAKDKLINVNTIVFITKSQIKNPQNIEGENYILKYLGEIEYEI